MKSPRALEKIVLAHSLLVLVLLSTLLRFWKLGQVPAGLSLQEVNLGLFMANRLGVWILNPTIIRLPFVILGVVSIFFFYKLLLKLKAGQGYSLLAATLLSFSPWHIAQSRILSSGLLFFILALVSILLIPENYLNSKRTVKSAIAISIALFLLSILFFNEDIRIKVNTERNLFPDYSTLSVIPLFSNKFIESYRYRLSLLFEKLDIASYFFSGHPRERWGIEEGQKLYISFIPLLLLGALKLNKKLLRIILIWTVPFLSLLVFIKARGPSMNLVLIFPFVILATNGAQGLFTKNKGVFKYLKSIIIPLLIFEFLTFTRAYYGNISESQFSPRRPIYGQLAKTLRTFVSTDKKVLVNERLGDPEPFLRFYLRDLSLSNFVFRKFNVKEESRDYLFVDVLPDQATPEEPLYTEDGTPPTSLKIIAEFYDAQKRQKVYVY